MTSGNPGGCRSVSQHLDVLGDLQKRGLYGAGPGLGETEGDLVEVGRSAEPSAAPHLLG